jgi:hypothetical protein
MYSFIWYTYYYIHHHNYALYYKYHFTNNIDNHLYSVKDIKDILHINNHKKNQELMTNNE